MYVHIPVRIYVDAVFFCLQLQERLKVIQEERDSFEQRMKVALKERQGTLDENERLVSRCHTEKERRRKAEKSVSSVLH